MKSFRNIFKSFAGLVLILVLLFSGTSPAFFGTDQAGKVSAGKELKVEKFKKNSLHLKLKSSSGIRLGNNGKFIDGSAEQTSNLNRILDSAKRTRTVKLKTGRAQNKLQSGLDNVLNSYYRINFEQNIDMKAMVSRLTSLPVVETAYAEPNAAPAPASADFSSLQNYLKQAPEGVDSNYARTFPGGSGDRVKIYDLEYSWNVNHEDITKARSALIVNGTPIDPFGDNNHGTAVIGQLVADNNNFGITGAVNNSALRLVNVFNEERGYDIVNSLYLVAATAEAGDVVLIEQQTWGPTPETYDMVPVEWIPEVYDAIKVLTDNGIIVVEAAGNGGQNLDDSTYYGSTFPMNKPDSGAIIAGAGVNCTITNEYGQSLRLSRLGNSTYGRRVNLQGPGSCVTTSGYGNLYSADGINAYYTQSFNGTSSASSVVAAAVVSLSSSYKALNGSALSPFEIRSILQQTGTQQNVTTSGSLTGNIGAYPNLARALLYADKQGPSAPTGLRVALNAYKQPVLSWISSSDNVSVNGYKIYRNGVYYRTVYTTNFTDTAVAKKKTYKYYVVAFDASGNQSLASQLVSVAIR